MIKIELADIYDIYRLSEIEWGYTDFAKAQVKDEYLGYGTICVDTQVAYTVVDKENGSLYGLENETLVGIRPSMKYSYVKDFVEDKKEIKKGIYEVTFGEYQIVKLIQKLMLVL